MYPLRVPALALHNGNMTADLTDQDKVMLAELLSETIAACRFPLSPRTKKLRAILTKLRPPATAIEPFPPPRTPGEPSSALQKKRPR